MQKLFSFLFIFITACLFIYPQQKTIGGFESAGEWNKISSEGAGINISYITGNQGKCLKLDYEFTGAGWCGIEKYTDIALPDDYKFTYYVKGKGLKNNLEFKLLDSTSDNVWWLNQRNFEFPGDWQRQVVRKRNIEFAWGPAAGAELKNLKRIQVIIAASEGGKGTVYIDELRFEEVLPADSSLKPVITVSSSSNNSDPVFLLDEKPLTKWYSVNTKKEWVKIDFGYRKEFGGLYIDWANESSAADYTVEISDDDKKYQQIFKNGTSEKDFIFLKNGEARYIKINLINGGGNKFVINDIKVMPLEFSDHPNNFFKTIASYYPHGYFPRFFYNIQSFWNIIGVSGDQKEGLFNEDGAIEVDKGSFRIEPFLYIKDGLVTWNEAEKQQSLENEYLPIPSVKWNYKDVELDIKTFAAGEKGRSYITARYRVTNKSAGEQDVNLYLALRPYQVNPPWQFLNILGGASKITKAGMEGPVVNIDDKKIISLIPADDFGAADFSRGEIINYISKNTLPGSRKINDPPGFGSAGLKYNLRIKPGSYEDVIIVVPFYDEYPVEITKVKPQDASAFFDKNLNEMTAFWHDRLDRVDFELPQSADKMINTLKSNLAYILINRDGAAIQPGSRSYERAWIRDGALTSSALLRLGLKDEVREYLDWYSQYQFPSGKIPCVVDKRGADPTAENDSHGEYIFAIREYFTFTEDTAFLSDKFNTVAKTVDYIEYLVNLRKTPQYQKPDSLAFYGLVPESISHEGYSAKPMHSYWDDFFTLRGLKDAVTIASILNKKEEEERFIKLRDEFEKNLYNSINLAMKNHNIDYIPGCVELGDFDATSTTISIYPGNELGNLPRPALNNTFDKYYEYFTDRKDPDFKWDAYTPYEIRTAGTFLYLGQKEKTYELLDFFFGDQKPAPWNHWAEVVWKDQNTPKFIGDMPHTWIGSDYINVVRSIFIFEREYDSTLVVGLGFKEEWADDPAGIKVKNQSTYYGDINYSIIKEKDKYIAEFSGNIKMPPGKIRLENFKSEEPEEVIINGKPSKDFSDKEITIDQFPAKVEIKF
jgi:hypothetical protein